MSWKGFFLGSIKVIALIGGFFIIGFLTALITMNVMMQKEQEKVPSLIGKDVVTALKELNPLGLNLKIESQESHQTYPPNIILSQTPEPGKLVKRGRAIRVIVSKGAPLVTIPDVSGLPWIRVQAIFHEHQLKIGDVCKVHHRTVKKNVVISQDPPAHEQIEKGGAVHLLISDGPEPPSYAMPALIGENLAEARQILEDLQLKVAPPLYEPREEMEPGLVFDQTPKPGQRISPEDEVTLFVSKEKESESEEKIGTYKVLHYAVPPGDHPREVRIVVREEDQEEREVFNEQKEPGSQIELLVKTTQATIAFIYLDGKLAKEEHFHD